MYSDHYPIMVEFDNLPKGWIAMETANSWNMNKPGGWTTYERLTEAAIEKIEDIIKNYVLNTEEISELLEGLSASHQQVRFTSGR